MGVDRSEGAAFGSAGIPSTSLRAGFAGCPEGVLALGAAGEGV